MFHLTVQYKVVGEVKADWKILAYALGFSYSEVKAIDMDARNVKGACSDMLGMWLEGQGKREPRNWATLLEALKDIGHSELANEVYSKLYSQQ